MQLQVADNIDAQSWDAQISSLGGTFNHSSTYARYIASGDPNAVSKYLSWISDEGELIGGAIGFEVRSPHRFLAPFSGRFWLAALPVVVGDVKEGLLAFLRRLEDHAHSSGNMELEVGSFASRGDGKELGQLGFILTRRLEFELSLERSEDELWEAMEYKRRKNIKKAIRKKVVIRELQGDEGITELRRLQGHSSKRIVSRGGRDITRKSSQELKDPLAILLESGLGRIVCAEVDGQIVSAGLFTHFNGLVYHTLSGHSELALKTQAPTLLIWETIKWYQRQGAQRFNFGGCKIGALRPGDPEHGVYAYKKAFGTECIECTSGHKVLRRNVFRILRVARWAFHA